MLFIKIVTTRGIVNVEITLRKLNEIFADFLNTKKSTISPDAYSIAKSEIQTIHVYVREDKKEPKRLFDIAVPE